MSPLEKELGIQVSIIQEQRVIEGEQWCGTTWTGRVWETREPQLLDIKEFSRTNDDDDDNDNADNETNYCENRAMFRQLMHFHF